ncbi:SDR family oxidoreductase [Alphaproteobacteria bacterium]|nr:SDR family oxidoreductase [Alphaproteobacteria bacterium]
MNIFVTGASGFVGKQLVLAMLRAGTFKVTVTARKQPVFSKECKVHFGSIDDKTDWSEALRNQQVVIHAAARAHKLNDTASDPLTAYRSVNVDGTLKLAREAANAGVERFIFISSIKVNGESTNANNPFRADDKPAPIDQYGVSKFEAEKGLVEIANDTGLEIVIIRPPLVYGAGVKGNFDRLAKVVRTGLPLPLASITNFRSLVSIDNLVDLLITCVDHPRAANEVFLVSDDDDLSTPELLRGIAKAMGQPSRLFPCLPTMLTTIARCIGKKKEVDRLFGSLQVDIDKTKSLLEWSPPVSVEEGLKRCFPNSA